MHRSIWLLVIAACHYTPPGSGPDPVGDDDQVGPDAELAPPAPTCGVDGTALCIEFENGADEYDAMDVALDGSGNARDGLASNVVSTRRHVVPAVADDRSAGFGLSSSLTVAKDLGITDSFTIEAWVFLGQTLVVDRHWLVDYSGRLYLSVDDLTGSVRCGIAGGATEVHQLDTGTELDLTWHHLACTFDGATKLMTVYVDGSSKGDCRTLDRALAAGTGPTTIGVPHTAPLSTDHLFGSLDSVRIYNAALDAGTVCARWGGGACQVQCANDSDVPQNGH